MNLRPVLYAIGVVLSVLSVSMVLPMLVDVYTGHSSWRTFLQCIIVTAFFGGSLVLANSGRNFKINLKQTFLLMTLGLLFVAVFGALPFYLSDMNMGFTDSLFESMSGITTTGSTVIIGLDTAPPGILLWRAMLQWLGGIALILTAIMVMPYLNIGGMQLFRSETSDSEKAAPRMAQLARSIALIYAGLTALCAACYIFSGMKIFDSVVHAMSTISTGGFSTFDSSFMHYVDPWAEIVAIVFMLLGALPFVLYLKALRGSISSLFDDPQVRWFLSIVALSTMAIMAYMMVAEGWSPPHALRVASFGTVSFVTGTGFINSDYESYGAFVVGVLFFIMAIGGCAGSTTCGIKIFRFQVLYEICNIQVKKMLHPNGVFIPHYNGYPMPKEVPISVLGFFFLYALCFIAIAIALSYVGLDFVTALSGALTSLSNAGAGFGPVIGSGGSFEPLPHEAKWILTAAMLLGRLEIFTVLVLFTPRFWKI